MAAEEQAYELPELRNKFAIIVAIGSYDSPELAPLPHAAGEARALAQLLDLLNFVVTILTDDSPPHLRPTRQNILNIVRAARIFAMEGSDSVLLYCSGRSMHNVANRLCLVPCDAEPANMGEWLLPLEELIALLAADDVASLSENVTLIADLAAHVSVANLTWRKGRQVLMEASDPLHGLATLHFRKGIEGDALASADETKIRLDDAVNFLARKLDSIAVFKDRCSDADRISAHLVILAEFVLLDTEKRTQFEEKSKVEECYFRLIVSAPAHEKLTSLRESIPHALEELAMTFPEGLGREFSVLGRADWLSVQLELGPKVLQMDAVKRDLESLFGRDVPFFVSNTKLVLPSLSVRLAQSLVEKFHRGDTKSIGGNAIGSVRIAVVVSVHSTVLQFETAVLRHRQHQLVWTGANQRFAVERILTKAPQLQAFEESITPGNSARSLVSPRTQYANRVEETPRGAKESQPVMSPLETKWDRMVTKPTGEMPPLHNKLQPLRITGVVADRQMSENIPAFGGDLPEETGEPEVKPKKTKEKKKKAEKEEEPGETEQNEPAAEPVQSETPVEPSKKEKKKRQKEKESETPEVTEGILEPTTQEMLLSLVDQAEATQETTATEKKKKSKHKDKVAEDIPAEVDVLPEVVEAKPEGKEDKRKKKSKKKDEAEALPEIVEPEGEKEEKKKKKKKEKEDAPTESSIQEEPAQDAEPTDSSKKKEKKDSKKQKKTDTETAMIEEKQAEAPVVGAGEPEKSKKSKKSKHTDEAETVASGQKEHKSKGDVKEEVSAVAVEPETYVVADTPAPEKPKKEKKEKKHKTEETQEVTATVLEADSYVLADEPKQKKRDKKDKEKKAEEPTDATSVPKEEKKKKSKEEKTEKKETVPPATPQEPATAVEVKKEKKKSKTKEAPVAETPMPVGDLPPDGGEKKKDKKKKSEAKPEKETTPVEFETPELPVTDLNENSAEESTPAPTLEPNEAKKKKKSKKDTDSAVPEADNSATEKPKKKEKKEKRHKTEPAYYDGAAISLEADAYVLAD
eukprot:TRINITY_DN10164_c0_g1_i1.p1 TRINITY_DN10164_c0_g1~~TRINITY_DN10164_c0_g1_i1.p1  ORF type:complete len:1031 (-),score=277.85 TRINITY_DN10164_c0_g1_i1:40-3132(-)